jgi:hypothetical protein
MDVVNFDALKAQGRILDLADVDPNEDYLIIGKYTNKYTTDNFKYTKYPIYAIKAKDLIEVTTDGVTITGTGTIDDPLVAVPSSQFLYQVGDYIPSKGGVIYHRYLTGTNIITQNYLVVDLQDLGTAVWSNIDNTANNATSLWNGSSNQSIITSQPGAISGAAFLCQASTNGGLTDWYLPAIQELNKLWCNMLEVSKGLEIASGNQLVFNAYWSSTEYDSDYALGFYCDAGIVNNSSKTNTRRVRAVRQFSI